MTDPPEALRLFGLCEATRWAALPYAGGWYDQPPSLVDAFQIILGIKSEVEDAKQKAASRGRGQGPKKVSI